MVHCVGGKVNQGRSGDQRQFSERCWWTIRLVGLGADVKSELLSHFTAEGHAGFSVGEDQGGEMAVAFDFYDRLSMALGEATQGFLPELAHGFNILRVGFCKGHGDKIGQRSDFLLAVGDQCAKLVEIVHRSGGEDFGGRELSTRKAFADRDEIRVAAIFFEQEQFRRPQAGLNFIDEDRDVTLSAEACVWVT